MSLNDRFLNDYAAGSAGADFAAQRNRVLRNSFSVFVNHFLEILNADFLAIHFANYEIGRASCRERV